MNDPPIIAGKAHAEPSVFRPENLLREARRQKGLPELRMPRVGVLDPDGDLVRHLKAERRAQLDPAWACYHTELHRFEESGLEFGIVGCAVGAAFAALIAEQLFASGCELLLSMTSAGQLAPVGAEPPYFVLIDRALRDEGVSYHYMPPSEFSAAAAELLGSVEGAFAHLGVPVVRGGAWTTDAPYRETAAQIAAMRHRGLLAVEMEAAGLYAFAQASPKLRLGSPRCVEGSRTDVSLELLSGPSERPQRVRTRRSTAARRISSFHPLRTFRESASRPVASQGPTLVSSLAPSSVMSTRPRRRPGGALR